MSTGNFSRTNNILEGLSNYIYSFVELDENTSLLLLKFDNEPHTTFNDKTANITKALLSKFMNTTRAGSAHKLTGISLRAFFSSILLSFTFCCLQILLFSFLRTKLKRLYQINSFVEGLSANTREGLPNKDEAFFGWVTSTWRKPISEYKHIGLDAFFFLRFLRVLTYFFLSLSVINIPVLLPIHYTSGYRATNNSSMKFEHMLQNGSAIIPRIPKPSSHKYVIETRGLDLLSMSNISPEYSNRLIFHLILGVFVVIWFHVLLLSELEFFITEKNSAILDGGSCRAADQAILFIDNIPDHMANDHNELMKFFNSLVPDCIEQISFIPRMYKQLMKHQDVELKIVDRIETLETQLISNNLCQKKIVTKIVELFPSLASRVTERTEGLTDFECTGCFHGESEMERFTIFQRRLGTWGKDHNVARNEDLGNRFQGPLTSHTWGNICFISNRILNFRCKLIRNHREMKSTLTVLHRQVKITLRIPTFKLYFKKSSDNHEEQLDALAKMYIKNCRKWDAIAQGYCVNNLSALNCFHQQFSHSWVKNETRYNKAFIQFKSIFSAHLFHQILLTRNFNEMNRTILAPNPHDISWNNITRSNELLILLRETIANFLSVIVTIGWVIPVAFVGLISQIPYLTILMPYFSWLKSLPSFVSDMVSSILPILTLMFLTDFVPFIFRWLSVLKGKRTGSEVEIDVQKWLFVFLFVHIFLVVTVSSGVSVIVERIVNNPVSIPYLLASNLPKSANFFYSFILIRGMAYFSGNLLQIKELIVEICYYSFVNNTPRKMHRRVAQLPIYNWGSIFPLFSALASIGIVYSVIAPLILLFSCIAFALVLFSFKCSLKYQCYGRNKSETLGTFYPQALMQLYAGIYCLEICLIGLFALSNCYRLSVCMTVSFIFTIMAHFQISHIYQQRVLNLPPSPTSTVISTSETQKFEDFTFHRKPRRIWIPWDLFEISDDYQKFIEEKYGMMCDS